MTSVTVELHSRTVLTMNQRLHWADKARKTQAIRARFDIAARQQTPIVGPVIREATIAHPRADRRRDAENWAPSFKAATDGCVDAGLLPDDSNEIIRHTITRAEVDPTIPRGHVRITLTFTKD